MWLSKILYWCHTEPIPLQDTWCGSPDFYEKGTQIHYTPTNRNCLRDIIISKTTSTWRRLIILPRTLGEVAVTYYKVGSRKFALNKSIILEMLFNCCLIMILKTFLQHPLTHQSSWRCPAENRPGRFVMAVLGLIQYSWCVEANPRITVIFSNFRPWSIFEQSKLAYTYYMMCQ